jgi:hypothetical protein
MWDILTYHVLLNLEKGNILNNVNPLPQTVKSPSGARLNVGQPVDKPLLSIPAFYTWYMRAAY